jgi:hypothetical protein
MKGRRTSLLLLGSLLIGSGVERLAAQDRELTPAEQKAADMRLPELDRSALEPDKREPATVQEAERNPFGLVSVPAPATREIEPIEAETEEMRIRRILGNMRISGVSGTEGSYRLLLGSVQLQEGDEVPKLFADQGEILKVRSISERELVLTFDEKDPNLPPRTIGLGFDLKPRPRSLLAGELFRKLVPFTAKGAPALKPLEFPAVQAIVEGAESAGLESITERSYELMGEASYRRNSDEPSEKPQD